MTSKKVITREEWEKKLNDVKIRKEDMNKLVMNFLVMEGYVEAAEKFRTESGTEHTEHKYPIIFPSSTAEVDRIDS
ncbi:hypothetical protein QJS04_geneDACA011805 [Acorus gramineus]|uniref:LisH domain-containing protein n=1 Tax=Acorus gramineus TaxID=55184 RepID=A0AAV9BFR9_ACOGR|nr:hypothetical protein QJS04_geneDACA011805 [Acorus gramineus]